MVINDGSTDSTARICRENGIHHISLLQNLGIGGAVQTGYLYAQREGGQSSIRSWKSIYYMIKVSVAVVCASLQKGRKKK